MEAASASFTGLVACALPRACSCSTFAASTGRGAGTGVASGAGLGWTAGLGLATAGFAARLGAGLVLTATVAAGGVGAVGCGGIIFVFPGVLGDGAGLAATRFFWGGAPATVAFLRDLAAESGEGLAALAVFDFAFGEGTDFFDFIDNRAGSLP